MEKESVRLTNGSTAAVYNLSCQNMWAVNNKQTNKQIKMQLTKMRLPAGLLGLLSVIGTRQSGSASESRSGMPPLQECPHWMET